MRSSNAIRRKRGRFFRHIFLAAYVAIAGTFSLLLVLGVVRGLRSQEAPIQPVASLDACVERAEELRGLLLGRLADLSSTPSGRAGSRDYEAWAASFRERLGAERKGCEAYTSADPVRGRALDESFQDLRRALDLSEIHATHWARHLGPALERSAASLEAARN